MNSNFFKPKDVKNYFKDDRRGWETNAAHC